MRTSATARFAASGSLRKSGEAVLRFGEKRLQLAHRHLVLTGSVDASCFEMASSSGFGENQNDLGPLEECSVGRTERCQ